jgi:hypothetical protein
LNALAGAGDGFDLDASLRAVLVAFENSMGNPMLPVDSYSITDPAITKHLNKEIAFAVSSPLARLSIKDFPNEAGYFMLWELSVSDEEQSRRFIPVFVNDDCILRPLAGKKIWDAILDEQNTLVVSDSDPLDADIYENLMTISRDYAYDSFVALKDETINRRAEARRKYMYALKLRIEAAERISIENIKRSKLTQLAREKADAERDYAFTNAIFPEFKPVMVVKMEGGNAL